MENHKQQQKTKQHIGTRVVIFPLPLQGHIRPMLHLANALYSKGYFITIILTHFNSPDPTEFPNFTFHFIGDYGLSNKPIALPDDPIQLCSAVRTSCSEPFRKCVSQILSDNTEPIACLVADMAWDFAGQVADSFNLPRIGFVCGSVLASFVFRSLPLLRQNGYFPIQESQLEKPVFELPPLKVKDLPPEEHHGLITTFGKTAKTYTQGIIYNAFEELDPFVMAKLRKDFHPTPFFPIGPLNKYSSVTTKTCPSIAWLNTQAPKSVLYVSFGSLAKINKAEFLEVTWGLVNSKQPFLWVVPPEMIINNWKKNDLFPQGVLEMVGSRGRIMKWAPQQEVLAHPAIGGFWTHCGWNSTLEAISQGVPMICHPFFMDQKVNARYISNVWRIGWLLENGFLREDIEKAIKKVVVGKEGKEMRERAADLMEKANLCFMEGGSSFTALEKLTAHILSLHKSKERDELSS